MTRVAVTTAPDASAEVAALLRRQGLVPVILPCIRIEAGSEAGRLRAAVEGASWILATSARAIEALWPDTPMPSVPVAAVGPGTARAVAERNGTVGFVGRAGAAEVVARLGDGDGGHIVFPHADGADPETARRLAAAGWDVVSGVVYRTIPVAPDDDPVDAVVFASPSAVEGWCSARTLDGLVVGAIGHTTAGALAEQGHPADVVADRPSHDHLAAALAAHVRGRITS